MAQLIQSERPTQFKGMYGVKTQTDLLKAVVRQRTTAPRSYVLHGEYGTGKCVAGETWIATKDGLRQMNTFFERDEEGAILQERQTFRAPYGMDVESNLRPLLVQGKEEMPSARYYEGVREDAIKLTLDNGQTLTGSRNHPVCRKVGDLLPESPVEWTAFKDLLAGDNILEEIDYAPKHSRHGGVVGIRGLVYKEGHQVSTQDIPFTRTFFSWGHVDSFLRGFCMTQMSPILLSDQDTDGLVLIFPVSSANLASFLLTACTAFGIVASLSDTEGISLAIEATTLKAFFDPNTSFSHTTPEIPSENIQNEIIQSDLPHKKLFLSGSESDSLPILQPNSPSFQTFDSELSQVVGLPPEYFEDTTPTLAIQAEPDDSPHQVVSKKSSLIPKAALQVFSDHDLNVCIEQTQHSSRRSDGLSSFPTLLRNAIDTEEYRENAFKNMNSATPEYTEVLQREVFEFVPDSDGYIDMDRMIQDTQPSLRNMRERTITKIETVTAELFDLTNPVSHTYLSNSILSHNTTAARIFATALNCTSHSGDACGTCSRCQEAPALIEYDAASMGSVENIRSMRDELIYAQPHGYRTFVFDECHLLSQQAQSALLSVLEGVQGNTFFLFPTTHSERLLPTVRSRSVEIDFPLISADSQKSLIDGLIRKFDVALSEAQIAFIVRRSGGHARNAVGLFDKFRLLISEGISEIPTLLDERITAYINRSTEEQLQEIMTHPLAYIRDDLGSVMKHFARKMYILGEKIPSAAVILPRYMQYHSFLDTEEAMYCFLASFIQNENKAPETPQKRKFGRR